MAGWIKAFCPAPDRDNPHRKCGRRLPDVRLVEGNGYRPVCKRCRSTIEVGVVGGEVVATVVSGPKPQARWARYYDNQASLRH